MYNRPWTDDKQDTPKEEEWLTSLETWRKESLPVREIPEDIPEMRCFNWNRCGIGLYDILP